MAYIRPFKAFRYDRAAGNIARLVAPPYDVISPVQQRALYRSSPYNVIRLILGAERAGDSSRTNRYTRAKKTLTEWIKKGILKQDREPAIYLYSQRFTIRTGVRERLGFIALHRIESGKRRGVLPHEHTFAEHKQDRFSLTKEVRGNLSQVFSLIPDHDRQIARYLRSLTARRKPLCSFRFERVAHRLWRVAEPAAIARLQRMLKARRIFIADGHHRFEVACAYKAYAEKNRLSGLNDHVMMYYASMNPRELTILPTHRVVRKFPRNVTDPLTVLEKAFDTIRVTSLTRLLAELERDERRGVLAYGLYLKQGYFLLHLRSKRYAREATAGMPKVVGTLTVSVLHRLVLERLLGVAQEDVTYVRSEETAVSLVRKAKAQAVFFILPPTVKDLERVASAGERMPHKSTYFYPKVITGLLLNLFGFHDGTSTRQHMGALCS